MKRKEQDRLDGYLMGDLELRDLPPDLREEESRLSELLEQVRDGRPVPATLRGDVMNAIHRLPRSRWQDVVSWFLRPRTVRFSPATASGLVLATFLVILLIPGRTPDAPPEGEATAAEGVMTRFVLIAPEASGVSLTGDWVGWDADGISLEELRGTGVWTADVSLPPGVHEYSFVIDGTEWRPDPLAGTQVDDGFGRRNSLVMVSGSEA